MTLLQGLLLTFAVAILGLSAWASVFAIAHYVSGWLALVIIVAGFLVIAFGDMSGTDGPGRGQ